jgi:hypothetical protein
MDDSKVCTKCGVEKPLSDFYKAKQGKQGVRGDCKACHDSRLPPYAQRSPYTPERGRKDQAHRNGVSLDEYNTQTARPCYVCGGEPAEGEQANGFYRRRTDQQITGVICRKCASGLGFLGHDPERLRRALDLL